MPDFWFAFPSRFPAIRHAGGHHGGTECLPARDATDSMVVPGTLSYAPSGKTSCKGAEMDDFVTVAIAGHRRRCYTGIASGMAAGPVVR
jgi:hypothetical protein